MTISDDDRAVLTLMHDYSLKPGQMLLIGPRSIALLIEGTFRGKLPDKHVIEKSEWNKK